MLNFDMNAVACLYLGSDWQTAQKQGPKRFPSAAQAIRFAMEEAAPVSLRGALLVAQGQSYSGKDIARAYRSARYPFRYKRTIKYRPSRQSRVLETAA